MYSDTQVLLVISPLTPLCKMFNKRYSAICLCSSDMQRSFVAVSNPNASAPSYVLFRAADALLKKEVVASSIFLRFLFGAGKRGVVMIVSLSYRSKG